MITCRPTARRPATACAEDCFRLCVFALQRMQRQRAADGAYQSVPVQLRFRLRNSMSPSSMIPATRLFVRVLSQQDERHRDACPKEIGHQVDCLRRLRFRARTAPGRRTSAATSLWLRRANEHGRGPPRACCASVRESRESGRSLPLSGLPARHLAVWAQGGLCSHRHLSDSVTVTHR